MMRSGRNTRSAGPNSGTITRTGTRLTTPVSKPKPCIVRLEKISQKKSPENEDIKKPIGSARNRNIQQIVKKTPDRQNTNKPITTPKTVENKKSKLSTNTTTVTTPSTLMAGRAKRTPKPNPKYQNDSLITSFKTKIDKSSDEDDDDDDEIIDDDGNFMESDEDFKLDDGDDKNSSDDENKSMKSPPTRGQSKSKIQTDNHPSLIQFSTSSSTSNNNILNKSRGNIRNVISSSGGGGSSSGGGSIKNDSTGKTNIQSENKKTVPGMTPARSRADITNNLLRKRKMEFEKEREAQRKRLNMGLSDSSETEKSPAPQKQQMKTNNNNNNIRQYSGTTVKSATQQQVQSNKLTTSGGNKINQQITITKTITTAATSSSTTPTTATTIKSQTRTPELKQLPSSTTLNRQKQQQINLNGKNLNQKPTQSTIKIINKKPIDIDELPDPIGGDNTQDDDYETMPTFTIVNINDIIGKKGDVLIEKTTNDLSPKKSNEIISLSPPSRFNNNNNRRKTMHSAILTDKNADKLNNKTITASKRGSPQQQQTPGIKNINNNNMTKPLSKSSINLSTTNVSQSSSKSSTQQTLSKGPPRILNAGINNKKKLLPITSTPTPSLTKSTTGSMFNTKNNNNESSFEKLMKNHEKTKENLQTTATPPSSQPNNNSGGGNIITSGIKRKLPSEKVIIQRQGNKIIKKITCFETWYVINIPDIINDKQQLLKQQKNVLEISLIKIANSIKTINLPSSEWACKVSLQKMNSIQLANAKAQNLEEFNGDVGDPTIQDNEKYKYQPVNVMFRRNSKIKNNRMPYDRAVIFKNGMFFTNIEGKNVKLIGSPQLIKTLQDIEILLQIIDDMPLVSQFVEPASIIP